MTRRFLSALIVLQFTSTLNAQSRIHDIIYTKHGGVALTFDVFKPRRPNGEAVIFVVSSGWVSDHNSISPEVARPLTERGITVFEVVHGAQPKFIVPEIVKDIQRSVRFIRANASTYRVQPNKIGIFGASAGGHLSLMAAGTGDDGDPAAKDPVDRKGSKVQAVGAYFPPTDFNNFGQPGLRASDVPMLRMFDPAWGVTPKTPRERLLDLEDRYSPIKFVSSSFPPAYLIHGDKDPLVPYEQSTTFVDALKKVGVSATLVIVPSAGHDPRLLVSPEAAKLADWFVKTLK